MKKYIKIILKSISFFLIFIVLLEVVSYLLLPKEKVYKYGLSNVSNYDILREQEDTIDAIVIGDSLVYSSVSPMEIWHEFGYTVFDSTVAAQVINDSYKSLEIALQSQKPKVVFLETGVLFRDYSNRPWYYDYWILLNKYFPIFYYHNNWKQKLFTFLDDDKSVNKLNAYKGYVYINKVKPAKKKDYMKDTKKTKEIPKSNIEYFEKIVNLCNDNDIKLVIMSTPNAKSWNYEKHLGALKLAKEYNLEYLDLNLVKDLNIDWDKETKDKGEHLNYQGAVKVSKYLGNYLKETNLIESHFNDKEYNIWNKWYEIYADNVK